MFKIYLIGKVNKITNAANKIEMCIYYTFAFLTIGFHPIFKESG